MKPDYKESIVNLVSSIGRASGVTSPYAPLESLGQLNQSKNIVLIVIDGLGYNYLSKHGRGTFLLKNLRHSLTSVFPPSTGSATTTFLSGLPPQQHGVIGWYVHLKEFGLVSRILPYTNAIDDNIIKAPISHVIDVKSIFTGIRREYSVIYDNKIVDSVYTRHLAGSAHRVGYNDLDTFFDSIRDALVKTTKQSYVYSYWPVLDSISHLLGCESRKAKDHLIEFDRKLQVFIEKIVGTDTTLIITADHGFHDVLPKNVIYTRDHPALMECLSLPVCGDTRTGFCYVKTSKINDFEGYIEEVLMEACTLHKSEDMIQDGWFGLYEPHPRLLDRIGDYTLAFKDGHALINCFPGFEPPELRGHHGGVSSDEMQVPLIVIQP